MNKKILALALPSIAANITTPLLGIVDTAVTGHMGDSVYIAAIAVGGVMFNMLYWLFGFLRAGTSGMSAQAYGAGDRRQSALVLYRSLILASGVGAAMILLQSPLAGLLTAIMSPDAATEPFARRYFSILIWGAPAMLCTYALTGWFLGMQNSRMNFWTSLVINLLNIGASLLLVYGFRWKVAGVATGTLVAQWGGLGAACLFLRGYGLSRVSLRDILDWKELKRFFKVNVFIMTRTLFIILVTVWFTREGARQGSVTLAVNTMLMQMFMLFSYVMDGFAYAGEALIGRFVGAGDRAEESRCVRSLFRWGVGLSLVFTGVYYIGGEGFLHLLSDDGDIIAASHDYWWWAVTVPFSGFAGFTWDGVYIGATMTRELLVTTALSAIVFFAVWFVMFPVMGNHGLWLAFILYLLTRGVSQYALYRRRGKAC